MDELDFFLFLANQKISTQLLKNFGPGVVKHRFHIPLLSSSSTFRCSTAVLSAALPPIFPFIYDSLSSVCCGRRLRADYSDSSRLILFSCLSISPCSSDSSLYSMSLSLSPVRLPLSLVPPHLPPTHSPYDKQKD